MTNTKGSATKAIERCINESDFRNLTHQEFCELKANAREELAELKAVTKPNELLGHFLRRLWHTFNLWSIGYEWRRSWWFAGKPSDEWRSRNAAAQAALKKERER